MTIDERIEALTMNLELASRDIEGLKATVAGVIKAIEMDGVRIRALTNAIEMDAANIRSLANIAGAHEDRISKLEGDK